MKEIKLAYGIVTVVDDSDYEYLNKFKWCISQHGHNSKLQKYAHRKPNKQCPHEYMHRAIMDANPGQIVDHINGDCLDNRRCNLRIVTHSENMMNAKIPKDNTSGVKGIYWDKRSRKWHARINKNKKTIHLGYFNDLETAKSVRLSAENELFGNVGYGNEAL